LMKYKIQNDFKIRSDHPLVSNAIQLPNISSHMPHRNW
jgi:hypothetical protein